MKTPKTFFNYRVVKDYDRGDAYFSIRGVHYSNYGKEIGGWDSEPLTLTFGQGDSMSNYLNSLERATELPLLTVVDGKLEELDGTRPSEMVVSKYPHLQDKNIT